MKVEFYKHNLTQADKESCLKALEGYILTTGHIVQEFETQFAAYMKAPYAVGTSSCTNSMIMCLRYFGIGPGDEVITSPMSFLATSNAIEHVGAKPVYVDAEANTANIDANLLEAAITERTKAIIPIHLFGQLCDMKAIKSIADRHRLKIIEDACHSIEGSRDGIRTGELGDAACFSFYTTKNMTSGEGGAIICKEVDMHQWLLKCRIHGVTKNAADRYGKKYEHYDMTFLGYKFNMNNIQASLLLNQIDRLEDYRNQKEAIAQSYDQGFQNNPNIQIPAVLPNVHHARHIYTIWVDPQKRDEYLLAIQSKGVGVAINYRPTHLMTYYKEKYGYQPNSFPIAEKIGASTITLPLYPQLTQAEVEHVIHSVNLCIG